MENDLTQPRWYVLHVMSGQEDNAFKLLNMRLAQDRDNAVDNGIVDARLPIEQIEYRNKTTNKVVIKPRKRYPGYMLVLVRLHKEDGTIDPIPWDLIKGIRGIIGFVGADKPVPLPQSDVEEMLRNEGEMQKPMPKIQYNIGESVLLKGSAFMGYEGVIEAIDNEHARLKVSVNIFGRATPIEIGINEVERPH